MHDPEISTEVTCCGIVMVDPGECEDGQMTQNSLLLEHVGVGIGVVSHKNDESVTVLSMEEQL